MKVIWNLYTETIDKNTVLDDLLGDIKLVDDYNNSIFETNIYLNNWFNSLIDGLKSLENDLYLESDLITEPDPLFFNKIPNGYNISYKNQSVIVMNINDFKNELILSCKDYILLIDKVTQNKSKEPIIKIINFLKDN